MKSINFKMIAKRWLRLALHRLMPLSSSDLKWVLEDHFQDMTLKEVEQLFVGQNNRVASLIVDSYLDLVEKLQKVHTTSDLATDSNCENRSRREINVNEDYQIELTK